MHTLSTTARSLESARFAHGSVAKMFEGFPEDKATFQTSPTDNHLIWHIGHLAETYAWFASALDGKPVGSNEASNALFGMGSKPLPDPKAYPSIAALRARFDANWNRLMAAAEALDDADAAKAPLAESGGFLRDRLDVVEKAAWHDGWHAGQISGLRKALGLKGVL